MAGGASAAVALISLKQLDIAQHLGKLKSMVSQAKSYSKMGAPNVPGVPDVKGMVKKMIKAEADKLLEEARTELIALLIGIMTGALLSQIPKINAIITVLNTIIDGINIAMMILMPIAIVIFSIIIAVSIVYVVTMILGFIPSAVVAFGAGVSFDSFKVIIGKIGTACLFLLQDLWPIAFEIIAALMKLLKLYGLMMMVMGIIGAFTKQQQDSKESAEDVFSSSADDFANSSIGDDGIGDMDGATSGGSVGGGLGGGLGGAGDNADQTLVDCTLPSGEIIKLTSADCIAAGGSFPGMNEIAKINELNLEINDLNAMLGACLLPDGTVKMMTPSDCAAAGGCFGCAIDPNLCWDGCRHGLDLDGSKTITCQLPNGSNKDMTLGECNTASGIDLSVANLMGLLADLQLERDSLCRELGPLCNLQLGGNIITSLIHPNDDATVEIAIENTGKRKGFYQSDI